MGVATITGIIQGEWGKVITLTLKHPTTGGAQDISSYDGTKTVRLRSPNGSKIVTATATFVATGTDGKIKFSFAVNDIDRDGTWKGTVELGTTGDTELAKTYLFEMNVGQAV